MASTYGSITRTAIRKGRMTVNGDTFPLVTGNPPVNPPGMPGLPSSVTLRVGVDGGHVSTYLSVDEARTLISHLEAAIRSAEV
jgi:hypothetical protein